MPWGWVGQQGDCDKYTGRGKGGGGSQASAGLLEAREKGVVCAFVGLRWVGSLRD